MIEKKKHSKLKRFIAALVCLCVLAGVGFYLYEYTNVLSKILKKKYDITFVVEGQEHTQKVEYDTMPVFEGELKKEPTTTIEYVFDGWEPALQKVVGDATYTAKFKETERLYTLSVSSNYPNGGSYSGVGKLYPYMSDGEIKLEVNSGYIFKGWYLNGEYYTNSLALDVQDIDRDVEFEARFETIKKSITYNNLKEADNSDNLKIYDVTNGVFGLKPIKTNGFRFVGWYTGENGTGEKIETIDSSLLKDYVLYAHWSEEAVITFNADGEDLITCVKLIGETLTAENVAETFVPSNFNMSGYSVKKWYTDAAMTSEYDFSKQITDNFSLYGEFEYCLNEIYFYPYMTQFQNAASSLSLDISSREMLIAWVDYVRFYDIKEQVEIALNYGDILGSSKVVEEIASAYEELVEKTSYQTMSTLTYSSASLKSGYIYVKDSIANLEATLVADPNGDYVNPQQDYAVQTLNNNKRQNSFNEFNINGVKKEILVSTTEQLVHVLQSGYKPITIANSNADKIYKQAKDVLKQICNDEMTDFDKLRAIYEWLVLNVEYDNRALDIMEQKTIEYQSDPKGSVKVTQEMRKYDAWYAEGVFNNGRAVCEGFSKALLILAKIENIPAIIVTGNNHAWNRVMYDNKWYGIDATHGSQSVRFSESVSYEILTYTNFMFSDEYKASVSYPTTDYSDFEAKQTDVFNVYDNMNYDSYGFDMYITTKEELVKLFDYVDDYTASQGSVYITFEIATSVGVNMDNLIYQAVQQTGLSVSKTIQDIDAYGNIVYSLKFSA